MKKKLVLIIPVVLVSFLLLGATCTKQEATNENIEKKKCAELGEVCFGFQGLDCCEGKCEDLSDNPDQGGICK